MKLPKSFRKGASKVYWFNDTNIWKVGGYYRQINNFSWMIVPNAGHLIAKE